MQTSYAFAGRDEYCIALETGLDHCVLFIPPLFDEMNRIRHTLVEAMRELARLGVGSVLCDLPGTNESLAPIAEQSLTTWHEAVNAAATRFGATAIASIRGGTLIDHTAVKTLPRWRLSPAKGSGLLRTLMRSRIAADKEAGIQTTMDSLAATGRTSGITLAGNYLSPALFTELETATPKALPRLREVQPARDDAEGKIIGSPLWLRAEPGHDPALSAAMARDIANWITG